MRTHRHRTTRRSSSAPVGHGVPWDSVAVDVPPHLRQLAHLQHCAGNAAVAGMLSAIQAATLPDIAAADSGGRRSGVLDLHAGMVAAQAPPAGLAAIQAHEPSAAGWTGIKMSGAFVSPNFSTTRVPGKPGEDSFVTVDPPVASPDAVHESLFPAPGDHRWGDKTTEVKGVPFTAWHRVSATMSGRIAQGEAEHLADAQRAYELTYGLITRVVTSMAGQRFGPAKTPMEADKLAVAAFDAQLPVALSVRQPGFRGTWLAMLETLLRQSKLRDSRGWHDIELGPTLTEGHRWIYPLVPTGHTKIGTEAADAVVNYPAAP
jgi:hypothetical protein